VKTGKVKAATKVGRKSGQGSPKYARGGGTRTEGFRWGRRRELKKGEGERKRHSESLSRTRGGEKGKTIEAFNQNRDRGGPEKEERMARKSTRARDDCRDPKQGVGITRRSTMIWECPILTALGNQKS